MGGHRAPRQQFVALAVEMHERVFDQFGDGGVGERAPAMTFAQNVRNAVELLRGRDPVQRGHVRRQPSQGATGRPAG